MVAPAIIIHQSGLLALTLVLEVPGPQTKGWPHSFSPPSFIHWQRMLVVTRWNGFWLLHLPHARGNKREPSKNQWKVHSKITTTTHLHGSNCLLLNTRPLDILFILAKRAVHFFSNQTTICNKKKIITLPQERVALHAFKNIYGLQSISTHCAVVGWSAGSPLPTS